MAFKTSYAATEPSRAEIDALSGPAVLEFGASWCGICQGAQRDIAAAFEKHPGMAHVKVEDGKGRPLGRSYGVKLWPTLVFLQQGREVGRLVRPGDAAAIERELAAIAAG